MAEQEQTFAESLREQTRRASPRANRTANYAARLREQMAGRPDPYTNAAEQFVGALTDTAELGMRAFTGGSPEQIQAMREGRGREDAPTLRQEIGTQLINAPGRVANFVFNASGLPAINEALGGDPIAPFRTDRTLPAIAPPNNRPSGRIGQVAGETVPFAYGLNKIATKVKPFTQVGDELSRMGRVQRAIQDTLNKGGNRYQQMPGRVMMGETAAGGFSGAGGYALEQKYPDHPVLARFIGEATTGFSPQLLAWASKEALGWTGRRAVGVAKQFPTGRVLATSQTGQDTADAFRVARAQSQMPSGNAAADRMLNVTLDPETALANVDNRPYIESNNITNAMRTADPGPMSLEFDVNSASDAAMTQHRAKLASLNEEIKDSLYIQDDGYPRGRSGIIPDPGTAQDVERVFQETRQELENALQADLYRAGKRTDGILEGMGPNALPEEYNNAARLQINRGQRASNYREKLLYDGLDQNMPMGTANGRQALEQMMLTANTAPANLADIPQEAIDALGPPNQRARGRPSGPDGEVLPDRRNQSAYLGDDTTLRGIRGLISKLREVSREARVGSATRSANPNQARMADEIADALLKDILAADPNVAADVQLAVDYSRLQARTFRQGAVGQILGHVETGADIIPEGMTLDRTLGVRGGQGNSQGREVIDDLLAADDLRRQVGDAPGPVNANMPEMREVLSDFINEDFLSYAMGPDGLDTRKAFDYLSNNKEMLRRVPEIEAQITDAMNTGNFEALAQSNLTETIDSLDKQMATLFTANNAQTAWKEVLSSDNPALEVGRLVEGVNRDMTGRALEGLKSSFTDYAIQSVTDGNKLVSGQKLNTFLANNQDAMSQLFSPGELSRLEAIENTAEVMDMALAAGKSIEGIENFGPKGKWLVTMAALLGASTGRNLADLLGTRATLQYPQVMSENFARMAREGIPNPPKRFIEDAMKDENIKMFRALFQDPASWTPDQMTRNTGRLNAWMSAVLVHEAGDQLRMPYLTQPTDQDRQEAGRFNMGRTALGISRRPNPPGWPGDPAPVEAAPPAPVQTQQRVRAGPNRGTASAQTPPPQSAQQQTNSAQYQQLFPNDPMGQLFNRQGVGSLRGR